MATPWMKEQMCVLIEAVKEEQCLYNVKSKNYYNKHCRTEALSLVFCKVKCVRPQLSNPKDCQMKFYNMRNMYNVENRKRKESMRSGVGTDDVYTPALWYFHKLQFLEEHYIPRNSVATPLSSSSSPSTEHSYSFQMDESSVQDNAVRASTHAVMVENDIDFSEELIAEVPSPVTTLSVGQSGAARNSTPKRRKRSEEGNYSSALQLIAERLQTNSDDDVDTFVKYLATEMKAIRSHETRMLVKQQILQLVYEAVVSQ